MVCFGWSNSYNNQYLFNDGAAASPGIESVAETGEVTPFQTEITANANANQFINGGGLGTARGTISVLNLQVSEDYPLITLASMIAPSPDWFIAINSLNLRSGNNGINNGWKDTFTIDVFPYDAGTEDGSGYSANNTASNPIGVITNRSNTTPFNDKKIGTFTFTFNASTLGLERSNSINNIKIFPNPSDGNITISNIKSIDLKTIEVYNVLGRLVKQVLIDKGLSKLNIDLSHLNNGIYLLKLKDTNNEQTKTQKLIIN